MPLNGLSWPYIALMLTAPLPVAALAAWPFWRRREVIFGNLAGTAVIFGTAFALILRESVELNRITERCLASGYTCWPEPAAFTRHAIYAGLGLIEVFALFLWSLRVEEKIRRSRYAPEWR